MTYSPGAIPVFRIFLLGITGAIVFCVVGGVGLAVLFLDRIPEKVDIAGPSTAFGPFEFQLVYAIPEGGRDLGRDRDGSILSSVESAQRWFEGQTGGRRIGFASSGGKPTVLKARLTRSEDELAEYEDWLVQQVEHELHAQGFSRPGTLYAVYYEGSSNQCGVSTSPPETPGNALVLILNTPDCSDVSFSGPGEQAGYWESALLHEIFHLLGAVPECAPHEGTSDHKYADGHVNEPNDLMYHGDQTAMFAILDIDRDDYYGHGRLDCFDVAHSPYLRPLATRVQPILLSFKELKLTGGCTENDMASSPREPNILIYVVNSTSETMELKWIDRDGIIEHYEWIQPWQSLRISTPVGTAWLIADKSGNCRSQFVTPNHSARAWFGILREVHEKRWWSDSMQFQVRD